MLVEASNACAAAYVNTAVVAGFWNQAVGVGGGHLLGSGVSFFISLLFRGHKIRSCARRRSLLGALGARAPATFFGILRPRLSNK